MNVYIGTTRSDRDGFDGIATVVADSVNVAARNIILDFSLCDFFEANMAAPLYVAIAKMKYRYKNVKITGLSPGIALILKKNRFLSLFGEEKSYDLYQTTIPFRKFRLHEEKRFTVYLESYMRGKGIPSMSPALNKRFRQSLLEIFLNARIHSESKSGVAVCGQFYPNMHRLDFSISDAGIGIRDNVRRYTGNPKVNSLNAIRWALTEGKTTKKDQPGGLGLKLIKEFIEINGGKLQIVSRFGYYEFSSNGEIFEKMEHDFPGTCVNIEINTLDTHSYCLRSENQDIDIF